MRSLTAAACALALAAPALALAASGTSVRDGDDTSSPLDIASARGAHDRKADVLVHVVRMQAPFDIRSLASARGRPPGSICVNVWTRSVPGEAGPDYEVCATPNRAGTRLHASVFRQRRRGPDLRLAGARVRLTRGARVELRFDPDVIHRPASYRWVAQTSFFGAGCPAPKGCEDFAPNRPKTARTPL